MVSTRDLATSMIAKLEFMIPDILKSIHEDVWDSLIINRRKPYTYRLFRQFGPHGQRRVCLHKFDPCSESDAFPHPHPWPGAFMILDGEYKQSIGISEDLKTHPKVFYHEILRPYSTYEIADPHIWHIVQPLKTTYTVMINDAPWDKEEAHTEVRTTKGKDLKTMSSWDVGIHLKVFDRLLSDFLSMHGGKHELGIPNSSGGSDDSA